MLFIVLSIFYRAWIQKMRSAGLSKIQSTLLLLGGSGSGDIISVMERSPGPGGRHTHLIAGAAATVGLLGRAGEPGILYCAVHAAVCRALHVLGLKKASGFFRKR